MRENNNWTRLDEERVEEVLTGMGLTQAVDNFLMLPALMDMFHNLFVGSCDGLKALIEGMPEEIRETLMGRLTDEYETAEPVFTNMVIAEFKETLAEINCVNNYMLGNNSGVALCYKMALEEGSESLKAAAENAAEEVLDKFVDAFKKSWMIHLPGVTDQETMKAILKEAMGDEIPDLDGCVVVPVNMEDVLRGMSDEDEDDE